MKKRLLSVLLTVILLLTAITANAATANAAGKIKVYQTNAVWITEMKRSKGKLMVKADAWGIGSVKEQKKWILTAQKALSGKTRATGKKKRTFKLVKTCKWSRCDTGENSGKYSYSNLRKSVKGARKWYLKTGYDASYGVVQIFVRNNKVVRVNIFTS